MDLRIDAKKSYAVIMTDNNAPIEMKEYPTPSPSIGCIPRTPDSTSSRYSLDEKVHSAATFNNANEEKPVTGTSRPPTKQYLPVSPSVLAEILRRKPIRHQRDTKPSTMILKKIQQLKRARDMGIQESPPRQTLVYRTMANYSRIDENAFISIDEQGFHEKKRILIQIEDDLLKDENILKKFKPNDFHRLPKTLKSGPSINLMAQLLKSTCAEDLLPENESLAWLLYIACMQRGHNRKDRNSRRPRKVRKSRPGKNQITDRFKLTIKTLSMMDVQLLSFKNKGATIDLSIYSPDRVKIVENRKLTKDQSLQEDNSQDPVPQKENPALKDITPAKPQPVASESSGSAAPENNPKLPKDQRLQEKKGQNSVSQKENLQFVGTPPAKPQPLANESSGSAVLKLPTDHLSKILQESNAQYHVPQKQNLALKDIPPARPQLVANGSGSPVPKLPTDYLSKILQESNGQYLVPQKQNLALKNISPARPQLVANGSGSPVPKLPKGHSQSPKILQGINGQYPLPRKQSLAVLRKELKKSIKSESLQSVNMIGLEVAIKYPYPCEHNPDLYVIGPNGSTIAKSSWENINWGQSPAAITRKFLMCLFDKYTLATHSLSGRPSPAFKGIYKAEKMPLHPGKVADTVSIVTSHVNVTPKEVRMAITTKCADECKMLRIRQEKKSKINKEFLEKLGIQQV